MTKLQAQILELFRALPDDQQKELVEQLYAQTVRGSFYERMTPEQKAQLQEGIDQADRGEIVSSDEAFGRLAKKFGFERA